jgi:hypothetical protein
VDAAARPSDERDLVGDVGDRGVAAAEDTRREDRGRGGGRTGEEGERSGDSDREGGARQAAAASEGRPHHGSFVVHRQGPAAP